MKPYIEQIKKQRQFLPKHENQIKILAKEIDDNLEDLIRYGSTMRESKVKKIATNIDQTKKLINRLSMPRP